MWAEIILAVLCFGVGLIGLYVAWLSGLAAHMGGPSVSPWPLIIGLAGIAAGIAILVF
jgi:hypothetical protein